MPEPTPRPPWLKTISPFLIGGLSGSVATTIIQPIDMIKVRIQLASSSSSSPTTTTTPTIPQLTRAVISEGGLRSLYTGISAAYLRQFSYTTLRIGFFDTLLNTFQSRADAQGRSIGFGERAAASLGGGGAAAFLANPAEVALVRMQSDGMRPVAERTNYRSVVHALGDIARGEGVRGLWRGAGPTTVRAMATNFGQLAFFAESKSRLRGTGLSEQGQTVVASGVAGFFAAFFSLPFDFMKTRLQRSGGQGSRQYKGMWDCAVTVAREEGLLRFYKGFTMYFFRIAPHTVITLFVADNLRGLITGETF